jgi:hypothetical protein
MGHDSNFDDANHGRAGATRGRDHAGRAATDCPGCGNELPADDSAQVGDAVDCPQCGCALRVAALSPTRYGRR